MSSYAAVGTSSDTTKRAGQFLFIVGGVTALGLLLYKFGGNVGTPAKGSPSSDSAATSTTNPSDTTQTPPTEGATTPPPLDACAPSVLADVTTRATDYVAGTKLELNTLTPADTATLTTKLADIQRHYDCLSLQLSRLRNVTTYKATEQAKLANLEKTIEQRKNDLKVAQDRAALAANPGLTRSNYDGWFPMERPLKQTTIPILIGFGLFLSSIALMMLMSIFGIDVRVLRRSGSNLSPAAQGQFTWAFWSMAVVAATAIGAAIYMAKTK